ncbi:MAG: peptidylprolyl isomerase [Sandaracinus sp.]
MSSSWRRVAAEPLVHFVVVGALLALLDHVRTPEGASEAPRAITVDDGVRRDLADAFLHEHGHAPSDEELAPLVDDWVDQEVLYREGLVRGLDQGDARVRQRVASLMEAIVVAEHPVADPTEEEVRAYFDAHAERWAEEVRVDFEHVFVAGSDEAAEARANGYLADLRAGASPIGMGDSFTGGRHYRGRHLDDLSESFGAEFVVGLDTDALDVWTLHRSRFGLHLVRIEQRTAASAAEYERARPDVEHALREERRAERARRSIAALREHWEILER